MRSRASFLFLTAIHVIFRNTFINTNYIYVPATLLYSRISAFRNQESRRFGQNNGGIEEVSELF